MKNNLRSIVYKRVKVLMPHCPICSEQLQGNNSMVNPFRCSCGIWESDWFKHPTEFKVRKTFKYEQR